MKRPVYWLGRLVGWSVGRSIDWSAASCTMESSTTNHGQNYVIFHLRFRILMRSVRMVRAWLLQISSQFDVSNIVKLLCKQYIEIEGCIAARCKHQATSHRIHTIEHNAMQPNPIQSNSIRIKHTYPSAPPKIPWHTIPYHAILHLEKKNRSKSGQVNPSHVNYANLFAKWKWLAIEFAVDGHA